MGPVHLLAHRWSALLAHPLLFADERSGVRYSTDDARLFIHTLADKLGVGGAHVQPGYEDTCR